MEQILINLLRKFANHMHEGNYGHVIITEELLENCANLIEFQAFQIAELNKLVNTIEGKLNGILDK